MGIQLISPREAMKKQTEINVKIVRTLLAEGLNGNQVAKHLGIARPMVDYYANGGSWKKQKDILESN
jgi:predicted transcriptional regulator